MQPISKTRIFIVTAVTILAILWTFPTARYYMFLRSANLTPTGVRPDYKTPPPPESDKIAFDTWAKENPQYAEWLKKNKAYLDQEAKAEALRAKAIPLGLDLIGGADVTLVIDREKAAATEINNVVDSLNRRFELEKVSAQAQPKGEAITVKVNNKGDALKTAGLLKEQLGNYVLDYPSAGELEKGQPVELKLNPVRLNEAIKTDIEGAKRGVSERVDQFGVTQPRVATEGTDRIRVQVPGVKDPVKLVKNIIQPAELEFHLVDARMRDVIGPDGKLKPGAVIPPGTEVRDHKQPRMNKTTRKLETVESKILLNKRAELTGKDLREAHVQIVPDDIENPIHVAIEFKDEAARKFADLTKKNVGKQLAIVLDGVVRSAPVLQVPILDGRATITGGFSQEEATELSQVLKAGSLPAPLKIESNRTVGATLGQDSIKSGVQALLWGSVFIIALMVLYYGTAGVIAVVALILNVLIILALMALSHATMTLSGIGGILLTVGMAVDANILIYERMREELRSGKPMKQALALGFHRAFDVIFDSNLTTLLSALVLLQFTEGSVFGFALAMTFGLAANLFTGLTVTYTLCGLWFQKFGHLSLGKIAIFKNPKVPFVELRWVSWGVSMAVMVIAIIAVIAKGGLNYGVDFAGGYRAEVQFDQKMKVDVAQIRSALENKNALDPKGPGLKDVNIQQVTDQKNYFIIDMKLLPQTGAAGAEVQHTQDVFDATLKKAFPAPGAYSVEASTGFGAQTSQQFQSLAIWVTVLASLAILAYLWFRFELVFGVAAVVALLHDLVIVFFLAALWGVQINLEVVAAMMVLMGFSVNDTIVIFDRIRENSRTMAGKSFGEICDTAMNQSLSRTILTSGTVLVAALCLYFIGGEGLRSFAKIYVIGVLSGTYSSDFVAAPILYQWNKYKGDRVRQMLSTVKKKKEAAKPIRQSA